MVYTYDADSRRLFHPLQRSRTGTVTTPQSGLPPDSALPVRPPKKHSTDTQALPSLHVEGNREMHTRIEGRSFETVEFGKMWFTGRLTPALGDHHYHAL